MPIPGRSARVRVFLAFIGADHADQLIKIRKAVGLPEATLVQR